MNIIACKRLGGVGGNVLFLKWFADKKIRGVIFLFGDWFISKKVDNNGIWKSYEKKKFKENNFVYN